MKNMDIAAEQRIAIKYWIRHGKTVIKTLSELKEAYGNECLAKLTMLKWCAIFVKDLSMVPVCGKPIGRPYSQITETSDALSIEAAFSKKPVVLWRVDDVGGPTSVGPHCMVYGGGISNLGAQAAHKRA